MNKEHGCCWESAIRKLIELLSMVCERKPRGPKTLQNVAAHFLLWCWMETILFCQLHKEAHTQRSGVDEGYMQGRGRRCL